MEFLVEKKILDFVNSHINSQRFNICEKVGTLCNNSIYHVTSEFRNGKIMGWPIMVKYGNEGIDFLNHSEILEVLKELPDE